MDYPHLRDIGTCDLPRLVIKDYSNNESSDRSKECHSQIIFI